MAKIITPQTLAYVTIPDKLDHVLKTRDLGTVQAVLKSLRDSDINPYLGRNIIHRHLFHGDKKYGEVDIVGAVRDLNSQNYREFLEYISGTGDVQIGDFVFTCHDFETVRLTEMASPVDRRFVLRPKEKYQGLIDRSSIDLALILQGRLEEVVTPRFIHLNERPD